MKSLRKVSDMCARRRRLDQRTRLALTAMMVLMTILAPNGLATFAQGSQGITLAGSTVSCTSAFVIDAASSQPELLAFKAVDGSSWLYVQEGPYTSEPYAQVETFQGILEGTPSQIMEGNGILFGGVVTDTGANMIVHQRYSDGTNGITVIIMAQFGGLAAAMQVVQQDCTIQGTPLLSGQDPVAMAGTVPGEAGAGATTTTTQPATGTTTTTTTTTTTAPASQPAAFEVAGSVGLANGTQVGWSNYWVQKIDQSSGNFVTLAAPTGRDTFFVQDYGAGMTLETTWETTRAAFGAEGSTLIDEGQSPDGGYYGIWIWPVPNGPTVYVMARAMYAPGTTTPTSTGFYAEDFLLDPMLLGIDQVSINQQTAWSDLDDNALRAIFQAGGPTGAPLFMGSAPAANTSPSTTTQPAAGTTTTTQPSTGMSAPAGQTTAGSPATFEVAGTISLENGTAVGWGSYWTAEQQPTQPQAVTLKAPTGFDMFYVQDYGSHMTLEATWETTRTAFSNGGTLLDEGQSPDGGYYGIWSATAPDGSIIYIMARAMYAPGATTPTSTGFYAFDYLLDPMLMGIDQVSINGQTAWADVDDNTLRAIFQAGGPTGAPLFLSTAPAATTQQTTQPGTAPQTTAPNTGTTAPTGQVAPASGAQYTSPQFGFTVSWAGGWTELVEARTSDTANGVDGLGLYTGTPGAGAVTIAGMNPGTWTPQSVMDYWLSPTYLAENHPAGTTVVLSRVDATRGGVVLVGPFSNEDPEIWVTVLEATFVNGQIEIDVTFSAPRTVFEVVYADAQSSVLVNGMPVVGLFTAQEIAAAAPGRG